jgi:transketolase
MNERSKQVRRNTIKLMYEHGLQHYGGSLSCIEILIALYDYIMTKDDIFLLSKGHCCAPLYVLLQDRGLNPAIKHHPHYDPDNGLHMTSGSLGHGIPFGIGVALAKKIKGDPGRVFVLTGDGCVQEGTFWESMLILNKLSDINIQIIVDYNAAQGSDWVNNILPSVPAQYDAFVDGHDVGEIIDAINYPSWRLIYAETYKGSGISFMEHKPEWHSRVLSFDEYNQALKELK